MSWSKCRSLQSGESTRRLPCVRANWHRVIVIALCAGWIGCSSSDRPIVVHGAVSVGGDVPDRGDITFVPIEGTPGSVNAAVIVDGQYGVDGRGGLRPGTYRVEIAAFKKTGRQVQGHDGFEMTMVDEQVRLSPPLYASEESPLRLELAAGSKGEFDYQLEATR